MVEIELQQVCHSFGREKLLNDVNLQIEKGEKWVLIGPSGEGKTTLLKILAGIVRPTEGSVKIRSQDLMALRGEKRDELQRKMGMLFQKNALFDSLNVYDNVAFPLRETTSLSEEIIDGKVKFYLEAVGLNHVAGNFPDEISGGMQKRLGIARALCLEPEIIFYDDPTAGLDPITSRKIVDLILELQKKQNSTLVAVTNDMNRAYQLADKIGFVGRERFIFTGNVEQTKNFNNPSVQQFIKGALEGPLTTEFFS